VLGPTGSSRPSRCGLLRVGPGHGRVPRPGHGGERRGRRQLEDPGRQAVHLRPLGQDFWTLLQAGHAPLGWSWHLRLSRPHQGMSSDGQRGQNKEMPNFTQALYEARELAMERMQDEARRSRRGIVGVQIQEKSHVWGSHTIEFFAMGTAVRKLPDREIATPRMVLSLDADERRGRRSRPAAPAGEHRLPRAGRVAARGAGAHRGAARGPGPPGPATSPSPRWRPSSTPASSRWMVMGSSRVPDRGSMGYTTVYGMAGR